MHFLEVVVASAAVANVAMAAPASTKFHGEESNENTQQPSSSQLTPHAPNVILPNLPRLMIDPHFQGKKLRPNGPDKVREPLRAGEPVPPPEAPIIHYLNQRDHYAGHKPEYLIPDGKTTFHQSIDGPFENFHHSLSARSERPRTNKEIAECMEPMKQGHEKWNPKKCAGPIHYDTFGEKIKKFFGTLWDAIKHPFPALLTRRDAIPFFPYPGPPFSHNEFYRAMSVCFDVNGADPLDTRNATIDAVYAMCRAETYNLANHGVSNPHEGPIMITTDPFEIQQQRSEFINFLLEEAERAEEAAHPRFKVSPADYFNPKGTESADGVPETTLLTAISRLATPTSVSEPTSSTGASKPTVPYVQVIPPHTRAPKKHHTTSTAGSVKSTSSIKSKQTSTSTAASKPTVPYVQVIPPHTKAPKKHHTASTAASKPTVPYVQVIPPHTGAPNKHHTTSTALSTKSTSSILAEQTSASTSVSKPTVPYVQAIPPHTKAPKKHHTTSTAGAEQTSTSTKVSKPTVPYVQVIPPHTSVPKKHHTTLETRVRSSKATSTGLSHPVYSNPPINTMAPGEEYWSIQNKSSSTANAASSATQSAASTHKKVLGKVHNKKPAGQTYTVVPADVYSSMHSKPSSSATAASSSTHPAASTHKKMPAGQTYTVVPADVYSSMHSKSSSTATAASSSAQPTASTYTKEPESTYEAEHNEVSYTTTTVTATVTATVMPTSATTQQAAHTYTPVSESIHAAKHHKTSSSTAVSSPTSTQSAPISFGRVPVPTQPAAAERYVCDPTGEDIHMIPCPETHLNSPFMGDQYIHGKFIPHPKILDTEDHATM